MLLLQFIHTFIDSPTAIRSTGPVLEAPLSELNSATSPEPGGGSALDESERHLILKVLREVDWVIGGRAGDETPGDCASEAVANLRGKSIGGESLSQGERDLSEIFSSSID